MGMIIRLFFESRIAFGERLSFILVYPVDLLLNWRFRGQLKKTHFFKGREFLFFGDHVNLLLDHLMAHLAFYQVYYQEAEVILDVGASFGTFSLMANYFNPRAEIYSFEPGRDSYRLLEKNCAGIKKIKNFNQAVGDLKKTVSFSFNQNSPEESFVAQKGKQSNLVKADQIRLDDFIKSKKINRISLLKIDVEGYEEQVLKGAEKALKITGVIIIEVKVVDLKNLQAILKTMIKNSFSLAGTGCLNYRDEQLDSLDLIFKR